MDMVLSDIEIANSAVMKPIEEIAESIGIAKEKSVSLWKI